MKKYKISVIIPAYNAENYLKESIESVINQSIGFQEIQLILVNDGSTDNSGKIMNEYAQKYHNVIKIHLDKSHSTGGFARNKGLKEVKGQYIMFLDADDCLDQEACKLMYDAIAKNDADIVTANYKCMNEDGKKWEKSMFDQNKYLSCELKEVNETLFYLYCPSACLKIFRADLIRKENIVFLDGVPAEDAYFTANALLRAKKILYLQEVVYYYRRRNKKSISTSWMRDKKYFLGINDAYLKIYQCFKDTNKIEYYLYFYAKNMLSILYKLIDSNQITDTERVELMKKMNWLFEHTKDLGIVYGQQSINILLDYILSEQYEEALKTCTVIREMRSFMNEVQKDKISKPQKIIV